MERAEKPYPARACASCGVITGWLGPGKRCYVCIESESLRRSFGAAHGDWVDLRDTRARAEPVERGRQSFWRRRPKVVAFDVWASVVDPDSTGPAEPEAGFEIEQPHRQEREAPDRSCMLVLFTCATSRFRGDRWERLSSTRLGRRDVVTPSELPADLPIAAIAEAWADLAAEVSSFNAARWRAESESREAARREREREAQMLQEQRGTADLLRDDL